VIVEVTDIVSEREADSVSCSEAVSEMDLDRVIEYVKVALGVSDVVVDRVTSIERVTVDEGVCDSVVVVLAVKESVSVVVRVELSDCVSVVVGFSDTVTDWLTGYVNVELIVNEPVSVNV
jgi:hypothetical protein